MMVLHRISADIHIYIYTYIYIYIYVACASEHFLASLLKHIRSCVLSESLFSDTPPGVIFGNSTNPIKGLVFDGVRVIDPPSDGAWGKKYYYCKGVSSGIAKGDTWPVPPCFEDQTNNAVESVVV